MSELIENQEEVQEEIEEENNPEEKSEHPIGSWWNPTKEEQFVETPIGGHVFPKKSREAAGME